MDHEMCEEFYLYWPFEIFRSACKFKLRYSCNFSKKVIHYGCFLLKFWDHSFWIAVNDLALQFIKEMEVLL